MDYEDEAFKEPEQREPTKQEHNILMGALKRSGKVVAQPDQDEVDIRSRLYQRIHELETQLAQPERDYERGFIDGMQKQMQSSVDKAVNRLAQPEQEPVAYCWKSLSTGDLFDIVENKNGDELKEQDEDFLSSNLVLLYTTPPQRKPLTLHELSKIFASIPSIPFDGDWQLELVRAVEAAHGIKE